MMINLDFLRCIREPVICVVDSFTHQFENGSSALEFLSRDGGKYALRSITASDGFINVLLVDKTEKIETANRKWMENETRRTGVEPSFF